MAKAIEVSREEARRVAVRAQALDGSAAGVMETVRRLGYLQIDPISTVASPQHLVLWSRLGSRYNRAELDRLTAAKQLFEWNAFLWPAESLPMIRAWMRRPRKPDSVWTPRVEEFLRANAHVRRRIRRELSSRGPMLSRDISHGVAALWPSENAGWWGTRQISLLLEILARRGEVAVVGRAGGQRLWGLAEDWYPKCERISYAEAVKRHEEQRFRALGVRLDKGRWLAHPDVTDGRSPDRATLLSPFDRLIHDRERTEALWDFRYRLEMYVPRDKREHGYYVLPLLVGDKLVGRAEPFFDRKTGVLRVLGAWGDTSRLPEALEELRAWLGASEIEI
jgi:uncharacterized protein YcaQ